MSLNGNQGNQVHRGEFFHGKKRYFLKHNQNLTKIISEITNFTNNTPDFAMSQMSEKVSANFLLSFFSLNHHHHCELD